MYFVARIDCHGLPLKGFEVNFERPETEPDPAANPGTRSEFQLRKVGWSSSSR